MLRIRREAQLLTPTNIRGHVPILELQCMIDDGSTRPSPAPEIPAKKNLHSAFLLPPL